MNLGRFWQKVKATFKREEYRAPVKERAVRVKSTTDMKPELPHNKAHEQMLEWCRNFNRRTGYIVPSRSPESIFRKAHRMVHHRGRKVRAASAS